MSRTLTIVFRRDPSRDRDSGAIRFSGYSIHWPDGQAVQVGLDAFCKHGQRLFGLSRQFGDVDERLVELTCFPLASPGDPLTRIRGCRIRRFCLKRYGKRGRVHFFDGTPTEIVFEIGRDETRVLEWIGLCSLRPDNEQWFDLGARTLDSTAYPASDNPQTVERPLAAG
jgi:hypothetical protein